MKTRSLNRAGCILALAVVTVTVLSGPALAQASIEVPQGSGFTVENGNECATSTAAGGGGQGGQGNQFAMLNHLMNVKDSRWLQLEVCREFQRGQCSRTDLDCKFAHPLPHVEVQNGKVSACYDSIKV